MPEREAQKVTSIWGHILCLTFNPLTACADYIRFFHFVLSGQPAFERVKEKSWHQSAKYENCYNLHLSNLNNFHSLEVVDRVSETQLQVGENSN